MKDDPEKIIALVEKTSEPELDAMTAEVIGEHPNTYTFTKHMAEHEVQKMQARFPCTIVRPSMSMCLPRLLTIFTYNNVFSYGSLERACSWMDNK